MRHIKPIFTMLSILLVLLLPHGIRAQQAPRILIVHSYHQVYPWTQGQHEGFMTSLGKIRALSPHVETEHLDTKRLRFSDDYARQFAKYLAAKYKSYLPDALYVTDDNALSFALDHFANIFPDTPVFFSGVNDFEIQKRLDPNLHTGVFEKKDPTTNLKLIEQIIPRLSKLCIVGDASHTHEVIEQQVRHTLAGKDHLQPNYIAHSEIDALEKALAPCADTPVLLTTIGSVKNAKGSVLPLRETIKRILNTGSPLIFSMEDAYVIGGALGGFVTSGSEQGRTAGELLVSYLSGKAIKQIPPVTTSPNTYLFDDQVIHARKLKIPDSIASVATMRNTVPGFFASYQNAILAALVLFAVSLLGLLVAYAIHVTRSNKLLHQQSAKLHRQGKKLEESEEKYRLLFERSEDPMLVIRDKEFVIANQATVKLLGYHSLEDLQDVHPSRLSPDFQPDGRPSFKKAEEMMQTAYQRGYHRFEWVHLKSDGSPIVMEVSLTRIPFEGENALLCVWHDLTKRKQAETSLLEKSTYLNSVLSASVKVGFIATDRNLKIVYFNDRAAEIFGVSPQEMAGKDVFFFHEDVPHVNDKQVFAALEIAQREGEWRFSLKRTDFDEIRYLDARISPIRTEGGKLTGYMLMAEDVTERHKAEELIKHQAAYDALTNLPNRRTLLERLSQDLASCNRHGHKGALLFLDLDSFKHINDSLGHPIGDALLKHVADLMKSAMRDEDTVARLGGDEFVILLSEVSDNLESTLSHVQSVAEKLLQTITQPLKTKGYELRVTTSIGITVFPRGAETADDLLQQADTALYQAKDAGRNTFRFFSPDMQEKAERRVTLVNSLNRAVEKGEFEVYLQPQIDIEGRLYGAEALVRWQHPEKGLVSPDEFIPLAEETGLINAIGNQVLTQTLEAQSRWKRNHPEQPLPRVSINLSAKQFDQPDFAESMIRTLRELNADNSVLTLELTESMLVGQVALTAEKMRKLKSHGIRFAIDDFGTGYSSLAYLKRLPLDQIKIDRSFVRDIPQDTNDTALVEMVLSLSEQLNLDVVAEGVETEEAVRFLQKQGCRALQGYYFSKPIPIPEFEKVYIENRNLILL